MSELDLNIFAMDRRDFLQAFALLSLGGLIFGCSEAVAQPAVVKSEYIVVNGWVLPAQHFQSAQT